MRDAVEIVRGVLSGEAFTYEGPVFSADVPALSPDAQAFQPYTSGSTGLPKGAIMTHAGMLWYVGYNQRYWPSTPEDRGLIASAMVFLLQTSKKIQADAKVKQAMFERLCRLDPVQALAI